jgi:hypothetical protein
VGDTALAQDTQDGAGDAAQVTRCSGTGTPLIRLVTLCFVTPMHWEGAQRSRADAASGIVAPDFATPKVDLYDASVDL